MALIHALMRLKDYELVKNFEFVDRSKEKAKVILANGHEIIVYMAEDYYVLTYMVIRDAWNQPPAADYVVYNEWDHSTSIALEEARARGVNVVSFGQFRKLLKEMNKNQ